MFMKQPTKIPSTSKRLAPPEADATRVDRATKVPWQSARGPGTQFVPPRGVRVATAKEAPQWKELGSGIWQAEAGRQAETCDVGPVQHQSNTATNPGATLHQFSLL